MRETQHDKVSIDRMHDIGGTHRAVFRSWLVPLDDASSRVLQIPSSVTTQNALLCIHNLLLMSAHVSSNRRGEQG